MSAPYGPVDADRCPDGCGCRLGTEDADRFDCACAGPCCFDEADELS